tara:strand:- start:592 stop:1689 length:1098 start_codon:yes stop_codon:yes gene_type:complete
MSIFSTLGKVFGFKGDAAQAFGTGLAKGGAETFTAGLNKAIDKFDKQAEETDKLLLADELEQAKMTKAELKDAVQGIKKYTILGFSPAVAAAIHMSPAETQKVMVDGANATEDKSKLDSLWKTSVTINKQLPQLSVMDAAKLLIGNQVQPQFDFDKIPDTQNMMSRLGFKANLKEAIQQRIKSRPSMRPDLTVDTEGVIPEGAPSASALALSRAYRKSTTTDPDKVSGFEQIAATASNKINKIYLNKEPNELTASDISKISKLQAQKKTAVSDAINVNISKTGQLEKILTKNALVLNTDQTILKGVDIYRLPQFFDDLVNLRKKANQGDLNAKAKLDAELLVIGKSKGADYLDTYTQEIIQKANQ